MSIAIPLTRGYSAIVSVDDIDLVSRYRWSASVRKNRVYAVAYAGGGRLHTKLIYMHRLIAGAPAGQDVDHINGNGLDNRRVNLRCASRSENNAKQRPIRASKSGHKGVWMNGNRFKKWTAEITKDGEAHRATFYDEKAAAEWYDQMAIKLFGQFAKTNSGARHECA